VAVSSSLERELVAHARVLRALARDLAGDSDADDLVQETALQALRTAPPRAQHLGGWLAGIMRHLASRHHRTTRRRQRREQQAVRDEAQPAPTGNEDREAFAQLTAAVLALQEPYQGTILQRYVRDLTPSEIAERTNTPVATVKTRLARALALLRERLERSGLGRDWRAALGTAFGLEHALHGGVTTTGVLLMGTGAKVALGGIAAALCAAVWWWGMDRAPDAVPVAAFDPRVAAATAEARPTEPTVTREAAPQPWTPPPFAFSLGEIHRVSFAGVVLDLDGHGVAGVPITRDRTRLVPVLLTDANGRFSGSGPGGGTFGVDDERYIAVLVPMMSGEQHDDLTIVVAPCTRVAARVVDGTGTPIAGARVVATGGQVVRERFARVVDHCADARWEQTTAADGTFALPRVPLTDAARLTIEEHGYRSLVVPIASARGQDCFVLERKFEGDTLAGLVVGDDGAPVRGVVTLHDVRVAVGADGAFRLDLWRVGDLPAATPAELVVASPGRLPGRFTCVSPNWRSRSAWPSPLYLRVGGVPERIRGRLLRADGTPCKDATPNFVAPAPDHAHGNDPDVRATPVDVQAGEFETAAVAPGRHRLWFADPATLDMLVTEPLPTGAVPVTLQFPDRGHWPALRGVIVERHGAPVPNADWQLERDDALPGARGPRAGAWGHANAAGRIDSAPPSRDAHTLCVKDDGAADWVRFPLAGLARVDDFRIVVPVRCRARIDLTGSWPGVDGAEFVDAAGAISKVVFTTATMAYGVRIPGVAGGDGVEMRRTARGSARIPLIGGRSRSFTALDDAVELRLFRGAQQVGVLPVALQRGVDNVVRP
jgi:RNA polymerase sigma-70 factor (ECF subfamily)